MIDTTTLATVADPTVAPAPAPAPVAPAPTVAPVVIEEKVPFLLSRWIPSEGRGAWLEAHPTVARHLLHKGGEFKVRFVATPTTWEHAGHEIGPDGHVKFMGLGLDLDPLVGEYINRDLVPESIPYPSEIREWVEEQRARVAGEIREVLSKEGVREWEADKAERQISAYHLEGKEWSELIAAARERVRLAEIARAVLAEAERQQRAEESACLVEEKKEKQAQEQATRYRHIRRALATPEIAGVTFERWEEGFMPDEEARMHVEDYLFKGFPQDGLYAPDEDEDGDDPVVRRALTDGQFSTLQALKGVYIPVKVEPSYEVLSRRGGKQVTVRVSLDWEGIEYSREYLLD